MSKPEKFNQSEASQATVSPMILFRIRAFIFGLLPWVVFCISNNSNTEMPANFSDINKEMYVIRAMVYQVGILTNQSDETDNLNTTGNQEAITYFHANGPNIDLTKIPKPLMTNVTAQSFVGVAPIPDNKGIDQVWSTLDNLTDTQRELNKETGNIKRNGDAAKLLFKRSMGFDEDSMAKIVKGTTIIPQEAGIQSLVIPPLLLFNNNLTEIPVPIPNTSVVQYAKLNTLVHMP